MKKSIEYISIKNFMDAILTPLDPYYGDDSHISRLLDGFKIQNIDMYHTIVRELDTQIIPKHTQTSPYFANYNTKQFIFLLTMIYSGLKLYSKKVTVNEIPKNENIVINAVKLELSRDDIKKFLRSVKQPLPYFMFPGEDDNTNLYVKHLDDVFNAVFDGPDFDKEINDYESMTPQTITEKHIQQQELQRLREAKELQRRKLTFPKEKVLSIQLSDISTEKIVLILECSISNRHILARELKNRKLSLEEIGHLLIKEGGIDSPEANTKRGQRLLDTEKK